MTLARRARTALETLRGVRTTGWVPLAYAEDGLASPYPEGERFTAARLSQAASNFDATAYQPPVVVGSSISGSMAGPVHQVGEYLPPVGRVAAVHFDGATLWGKFHDIVERTGRGKIEDAVSRGMTARSLALWLNGVPSVGGASGAAIRHVALIGSETPGQMHHAPLTTFLTNALGAEVAARDAAADASTVSARTIAPDDWQHGVPRDVEETEMDPNEIEAAVQRAVNAALGTALPAALKPLTDQVAAHGTVLTGMRTSLDEAAAGNRRREAEGAVAELVSSGRVAPAERESEITALTAMKPADSEARLGILRARESKTTGTRTNVNTTMPRQIGGAGGRVTAAFSESMRTTVAGLDQLAAVDQVDPGSIEFLGQIAQIVGVEGMSDPNRVAEAAAEITAATRNRN